MFLSIQQSRKAINWLEIEIRNKFSLTALIILNTSASSKWTQKLRSISFNLWHWFRILKITTEIEIISMTQSISNELIKIRRWNVVTYKKHLSVEMPITPSRSSCSKFGHRLAIFSKSRSVNPRIAAKKSFLRFGQPLNNFNKLSPGDASSRKLWINLICKHQQHLESSRSLL